jgi:CubicO group peptidase (beta-lactamase class C family)
MTRRASHQPYVDIVRALGTPTPAIEAWARELLDSGRSPTAQAAVYRDGDLIVSLTAGSQPPHGHATRQSLYCWLSCTKLFSTVAMLTLHDRGYFAFDDPVAQHWPEFGANGKDRITIRQVLSHRAGIRLGPPGTSWGWWGDRAQVGRWLVSLTPEWEPGSAVGYHNRVWGFLLDQLAWRWTGKGIDGILRDEVCAPVGITDFHMGIGAAEYARLLKAVPPRQAPSEPPPPRRVDPQVLANEEFRPRIGDEGYLFNAFELLRLPLAWGTSVATAEAAADIANFVALGGAHRGLRLIEREVMQEVAAETAREDEVDRTRGVPARWWLGLQREIFPQLPGAAHRLGHGGGNTAYVWVDTERRLSVAAAVSGLPRVRQDTDRWRLELAQAVYQDLFE